MASFCLSLSEIRAVFTLTRLGSLLFGIEEESSDYNDGHSPIASLLAPVACRVRRAKTNVERDRADMSLPRESNAWLDELE
jgi:hypothetical protein